MFLKRRPAPTTSRSASAGHRAVLRAATSLLLTLCLVAAVPLTDHSGILANLEAQSLDLRFRLRGPMQPGPDVALVMVDEKTVETYGRWPLPRERLAEAVRRLKADGAALIGFDLLFLEESQSDQLPAWAEAKIRAALAARPEQGDFLQELLRGSRADEALADAIREAGNVLVPYAFVPHALVSDIQRPGNGQSSSAIAASAFSVVRLPSDLARPDLPFDPVRVLAPQPGLLRSAAGTGHVTVALAGDGSLRHHVPVVRHGEEYFPSLPLELARLRLGVPKHDAAVLFGSGIDLGSRFLPTDRRMRFLVNYYGPDNTFPTWSLADVLEGRTTDRAFRGRVVLIGASATGAADTFPTPFTAGLPGTEYFATVLDNLLGGRLLRRDDFTAGIDLIGILGGGAIAAVAGYLAPVVVSSMIALLLLAGWGALTYAAFAGSGLWIGFVLPAAAIVLNSVAQQTWGALVERRRRRAAERQRLNLSRYFAPTVVEALAERDGSIEKPRLQNAAVLFVDLEGFTGICERLPPEEAMELLRRFHRLVERAVFANAGTLDKFIGDGALAVFGVPVTGEADAARALRCARQILRDVSALEAGPDFRQNEINATLGIHFGPVLAGDVGGERQFQYTVTGDTVNVASRLQGFCRDLSVRIMVSEAAVEAARRSRDWEPSLLDGLHPVSPVHLRGREQPIPAWAEPRTPPPPSFSKA